MVEHECNILKQHYFSICLSDIRQQHKSIINQKHTLQCYDFVFTIYRHGSHLGHETESLKTKFGEKGQLVLEKEEFSSIFIGKLLWAMVKK